MFYRRVGISNKWHILLPLYMDTNILNRMGLSFVPSAGLAHVILKEKLHALGFLGCIMCLVGSVTMVLHAPKDRTINSVQELWELATQTGRMLTAVLFHYSRPEVLFIFVLAVSTCRFPGLCDVGFCICCDPDHLFCPSLRADSCGCVYKYLLIGWLIDGTFSTYRYIDQGKILKIEAYLLVCVNR